MTTLSQQLADRLQNVSYVMEVPAFKGQMGGVDYFVITLPFSVAKRYLTMTDNNLPAKERENRKPKTSRYAEIASYIIKNPDDYRFSALTCTYGKNGTDRPLDWKPIGDSGDSARIGILELDQRDPLIIVDGQHRFAAILRAFEEDPGLADETMTIVLFPYISLKHSQQLFSDLNRTAKKTTKSLDILFDHRDAYNRVVQQVVEKVSVFKDRVNLEDASVPINSNQMFTLAGVYQASKPIIQAAPVAGLLVDELAKQDDSGEYKDNESLYVDFLAEVWEFIASLFPEWGQVEEGELDIRAVRSKFLHWHSGVVSTVGDFVALSMREKGKDWQDVVRTAILHPTNYEWKRDARSWQGIITSGTQVLPRSLVRPVLKAHLKQLAGLPLTAGDQRVLQDSEELKKKLGV